MRLRKKKKKKLSVYKLNQEEIVTALSNYIADLYDIGSYGSRVMFVQEGKDTNCLIAISSVDERNNEVTAMHNLDMVEQYDIKKFDKLKIHKEWENIE